jgi:hypothetical protein
VQDNACNGKEVLGSSPWRGALFKGATAAAGPRSADLVWRDDRGQSANVISDVALRIRSLLSPRRCTQRRKNPDHYRGALPFVGLKVAVLALIIAVPGLVDWLPRLTAAMAPGPVT